MKTWTNPEVEELDVKLTANGNWTFDYETLGEAIEDNFPVEVPEDADLDLPIWDKKEKTES